MLQQEAVTQAEAELIQATEQSDLELPSLRAGLQKALEALQAAEKVLAHSDLANLVNA